MRTGKSSLRSKSLLFLLGYTLALEGSILSFFYYSGLDTIRRRSEQEVRAQATLARAAVDKALADATAELDGLRAQLLLYPTPARVKDASLRLVEQLILSSPRRFSEVRLSDRGLKRFFASRPVSELGVIYAVTGTRGEPATEDICAADAPRPCIAALPDGLRDGLVRVVAPVDAGGSRTLAADLHLDPLLEAAGRLILPPHVSLIATNRRGMILLSGDPELMRTYLAEATPAGTISFRQEVDRLDVLLTASRDESTDRARLRVDLARIAVFTGAVTLAALLIVWGLIGRMVATLRHVVSVANSIAAGDFSRRIAVRRSDELGTMIDSFNGMTARLETSYRELNELNAQLQAQVDELTRTRRRLFEKQRLAAVGEALSKISHEIQNKVGGVGVWVQNLERYGASDGNTRLCIGEIKTALSSFLDMLVHFKRFYREPQVAPRELDAAAFVAGCVSRVAAEVDVKGLRVEQVVAADARLQADAAQMADAVVNLLLNATHFSPHGGTVRVGLERNDGHMLLSVRDQGPGIPPKAKLFRPFFTTRPTGSGLGLAIVRNIVHAHGGRVRGRNHPEGGACFEIRLP